MLKKLFPLLLFFTTTLFAQEVSLTGVVTDSIATPLSYANVIAKPADVKQNISFAISDEKGRYRLLLKKDNSYTISVSYLGYTTASFSLKPTQNTIKNIILQQAKNQLEEVVIELPVTIKKDTIIYNTDKFVNGNERKLKNVLKKLPGVEVDKHGKVTVQGKKVTDLLVDGKKFFGGGTKLGVENIPADAVDKVEVIDNYNEVAFLKDISDSDKMAMNIKLKEDKKRFVFGDIEAGKGNDDFYKTSANLFYYTPKTNLNFISNLNTIGEKTFTFSDYMNFQGGVNAVFNGNFNWKGGGFSQFLENSDLLSTTQRFAALNITKTTSSKLDLSGYAIFSHNNTQSLSETVNDYTSFTEYQTNANNKKSVLGIGKLSAEYTPNFKEKWYVRTQIKGSSNTANNQINTIVDINNNQIATLNDATEWYVNQNIEWHKDQSDAHTFSAIANYTYDTSNPHTSWNATQSYFDIIKTSIPDINTTQNALAILQQKDTEKHHLHTVFKDFWVLNGSNHIYSTVGNTHQQEKFESTTFQQLDNTNHNGFSGFNNETVFKHNDFFAGVHYKFRTGIFTFKQGGYLHYYDWKVYQQNAIQQNKWVFLPDFLLKIEFNKSKTIDLKYNLKTNFSNTSQLANRYYLQSYNSIFRGNEMLSNELYHSARLSYRRFSMFKGLMLFGHLNYTKRVKGYRSTVNFNNINRFTSVALFDNADENLSLSGNITKRIKKIRYEFGVDYSHQNYLQDINNSIINNKNNNYGFNVSMETLYDKFPTFKIGYRYNLNKYNSSSLNTKFKQHEPFVELEYSFLKSFELKADYTYTNYENNNTINYTVANASLRYQKEDNPWSFELKSTNMLNTKFKQTNSFSDYLISDTKRFVLPRVVLFSIGYKL